MKIKKLDKIVLFFFSAAIIATSLIWLFEERFDQATWHSNPSLRYKMADDIIDSKLFIGKTKEDVIAVLGEPEIVTPKTNYIIYKMGKAPSFSNYLGDRLVVIFEDTLVIEVLHTTE